MTAPLIPSPGRIVHYRMSEGDVAAIMGAGGERARHNPVSEGDVYPAMIVRVWSPSPDAAVNLQVFLDGDCSYWATSRSQGDEAGQWAAPARV